VLFRSLELVPGEDLARRIERGAVPLDEPHLAAAARYVERNPLRAGLAKRPDDWAWSSARAHLDGRDDGLVRAGPLLELIPGWRDYLGDETDAAALEALRQHGRSGRPLGSARFVAKLEKKLGRPIGSGRRGRPPKAG
jgi:putative transposase